MSWRIVPTRVIPMCRRIEADMFRHHPFRDVASNFQRVFDAAWKSFDMDSSLRRFEREMERMERTMPSARWYQEGDGIQRASHYVTDEAGNRKLQLQYDVSSYTPEEVTVKMVDNRLVVQAKQTREEESGEKWYSEFSREFTLPKEVNQSELKSTMSSDGILHIEAPVNPEEVATTREIPIEYTKADKDATVSEAVEGQEKDKS